MYTPSDVLNPDRILNSCVVEIQVNGKYQRFAGFRNVNINGDRQSTLLTATDDGIGAGQSARDDLIMTGTFEYARSPYWDKVLFDKNIVAENYGAAENHAAEQVVASYKKSVGIYEALLKNPHRDGTVPATVTKVDIIDENGAVTTAGLTEGTDYEVGVNNGYTTITAVAGGAIASATDPSAVNLAVDYSAEPLVDIEFESGEAFVPSTKNIRITEVPSHNTSIDEQPKFVQYTIPEAIVTTGDQVEFRDKAGENEIFQMPLTISSSQGTKWRKKYIKR